MTPQQNYYQEIMRKRGWFKDDGNLDWPKDEHERRAMARQVFGLELISGLDDNIIKIWNMAIDVKL